MLRRRRFLQFCGLGALAAKAAAPEVKSPASPVMIHINSPVGDRAEIGRSIQLALADYYRRTGRRIT